MEPQWEFAGTQKPNTSREVSEVPLHRTKRCPTCGGRVILPCRLCKVRAVKARGVEFVPLPEMPAEEAEPPRKRVYPEIPEKIRRRAKQLRRAGWTLTQIATKLGISESSAQRYAKP